MKKLLLTLIVSLALCGSAFAQYETHWPGFNSYAYEMQGGLVAAIIIDGEPITVDYEGWNALEIAAFVGEDECRAVGIYLNDEFVLEFGDPYPVTWGDAVFYTNPGEELYFKMYDHSRDIEYTFVTALQYGEPLTLVTGDDHFEGWDNPDDVISLSFVSPEPTGEPTVLEGGYWNVTSTWQDGFVPENIDVIINGEVIIPSGYTAYAHNITMGENGSLVIEDGGELYYEGDPVNVEVQSNVGTSTREYGVYRLIASPINPTTDVEDSGLLGSNSDNMDLYGFDQSYPEQEWRNYKAEAFDLAIGKGYLYAHGENVLATFIGMTVPSNTTYPVELAYAANAQDDWRGANLLGNPFTCKAYPSMPFYVLNDAGTTFVAKTAGDYVERTKGCFVVATEAGQTCSFTATPGEKSSLNITVNQGQDVVDVASLVFNNGGSLRKIQLNPNHTKVYMTQDNVDYAIATAEEMGEMPVSFKAESNGTYTLGFTTEGVSFNYLHLIDNMTGANVDLLATPSYTFSAQTTDYASRFRLVFATGNATEDSFAFMSNGNLIVSNDGEATLQVVDVNGRILTSESINGSASVSVNAAAGVYVLRLVNGNDVKVQKIVIR